jgi:hypothetical protein
MMIRSVRLHVEGGCRRVVRLKLSSGIVLATGQRGRPLGIASILRAVLQGRKKPAALKEAV